MKKLLFIILCIFALSLTAIANPLDNNVSYMGGYPDNTFKPDNTITRAEVTKVINVATGSS